MNHGQPELAGRGDSVVPRYVLFGGLLAITFSVTGCARDMDGRKKVVVTTGMIADLARNVAGDSVELEVLMGPGIDPHLFKAKESTIRRLFGAELILYNGLHLEGKMARVLEKCDQARACAREIPETQLLEDEGQHDPHIWFDVGLWVEALGAVEQDLCQLCPEHADVYHARAACYRHELLRLHDEVREQLHTIPKSRRVMVTAHDAFRYFGRAYDVEVVGLQGVSTASQAGLRKVQEVVDLVVSRQVKALFVESSVPPDGVNAVVERCRARGHEVRVADQPLFSDAMGDAGTPEGTYPGMIRHNVRVIVEALK
jgi:manganese/zinc/iron transport system substrate-binding protein